jgi:hypothetical protein
MARAVFVPNDTFLLVFLTDILFALPSNMSTILGQRAQNIG